MIKLKHLGVLFLMLTWSVVHAQKEDKKNRPSPEMTSTASIGGNEVTVVYSSPAVKGRTIWGDLVPYGKIWRLGANEATTITFKKDAKIGDVNLPAGKYAMFAIPNEKEWTIIFNTVWDQWGAYNYDESKDVGRIKVKPTQMKELSERMEIAVEKTGEVKIVWEHVKVAFEVE